MSASLQHILISVEEYDRLKEIESQFHKLHKQTEAHLQISSKYLMQQCSYDSESQTIYLNNV
jgi:hypothetical protein